MFTIDDGVCPQFLSRFRHTIDTINDVDINPETICRILKNLKSNSAAGPDGLPAVFFRNTSNSISFPLAIMFRSFIDLHGLPSDWSKAVIAPKFKKGQPSIASNYRPIALTCTTCKILEKIIAIELIEFLQKHGLINKSQHGFLKNHSTGTNLLNSLHDWSISLSNHLCTAIAYIDFQRAFDSVSHNKLIHKLRSYGIEGNLLFWIISFLSNRTQVVRVGTSFSSSCAVTSGIPQGKCLGPNSLYCLCERYFRRFRPFYTLQTFCRRY